MEGTRFASMAAGEYCASVGPAYAEIRRFLGLFKIVMTPCSVTRRCLMLLQNGEMRSGVSARNRLSPSGERKASFELTLNAVEDTERTHELRSAICFALSLGFSNIRSVSSNLFAKFGHGASSRLV
jgi:hypothetical protein